MMAAPPIIFEWRVGAMLPVRGFERVAASAFVDGRRYRLAEVEDRSEVSHRHEFAWLREAWQSLPDALRRDYPSSEHLRKRALIETGHCTMQDYVCGSRAEAARWAANLRRELDEYALVVVSESAVRVFRAKSQAMKAMGKDEFQQSKTDVLEWVAGLLQVEPETLAKQSEAA
jgi:hypothetical protein